MNGLDLDINWVKTLPYVWIGVSVIMGIIEAVTLALTTVWMAIGALLAMVAALLHFPFYIQMLIFILSSLILLIFTRPSAIKYMKVGQEKTNVESYIGKKVQITREISRHNIGEARLDGKVWSAVSDDPEEILTPSDEAEVVRIEGVKLVLRKTV
jgi:membrane protein implicated in regulation of membrane protease activity